VKRKDRIQSAEELAERVRPFVTSGNLVSLVPVNRTGSGKPLPMIIGPGGGNGGAPRTPASVIPVQMPSAPRVTDSLLVSPRIPRAPSTPKLRMGQDFMPMPGDPQYQEMVDARRSQTHVPKRRSSFKRDVMPALIATSVGFGLGVMMAWSAGLL
jgi:hypothetical protein